MVDNNNNNFRSDLNSPDVYAHTTITIDAIEGKNEVELDDEDVRAFFLLATLKNLMKQFRMQ